MAINIEKIKTELSKGNTDEQHDAYLQIKDFISDELNQAQQKADERANELQNKINKINGNA